MLTHGPRQAHVWLIFDVRQNPMATNACTELLQKSFELVIIPFAVGVITGALSSLWVSRRYRKKSLLDECSRLVRRLCPYRRDNVRDGDGLSETAWGLKIQAEILADAGFSGEAQAIEALSKEMDAMPAIDGPQEEAKRTARKDEWKSTIARLY